MILDKRCCKIFMQDKNKKEKTEYISLFEAAKKSGYAQDYLSLLCRQGKLKGEKIGRNWVTTYQWLDEYQQNLISDIDAEKTSDIGKNLKTPKSFKIRGFGILKRKELVLAASLFFLILLGGFGYAKNPQFFSDIAEQVYQTENQIAYRMSEMNQFFKNCHSELVSESVKKIPLTPFIKGDNQILKQVQDDIAFVQDDSRLQDIKEKATQQVYQTKNQIAYRMSEIGENISQTLPETPSVGDFRHSVSEAASKISDNTSRNIYSRVDAGKSIAMFPIKVGEKFGEGVITYPINIPMKIGGSFEKGFKKSDLVLNSSFKKAGDDTYRRLQDNFNDLSNGIAALLPARLPTLESVGFGGQVARNDNLSKFKTPSVGDFRHSASEISDGRVAGVSTEKNLAGGDTDCRLQDSFYDISNGVNSFSQKIAGLFGGFKNNIYLAISDAANALKEGFEKGIILCQTTLTIQSGDKKFSGVSQAPNAGDSGYSAPAVAENQKQETIQKSSEELSEGADNQMREVLIVVPNPESEEEKEKLKEKIGLSFSDKVKVKPEDATSGIITPVFRESEGDDYIYLLIPMKEDKIK